jgi:predicted RNA binding protein YcfA (HicA-like mRNA interferase family)
MPQLPSLKPKDLIQALKKLGFYEHRQHGTSHLVMVHADGRRAIIAVHSGRDIPKGTLYGILKDIKISPEDFRKLL